VCTSRGCFDDEARESCSGMHGRPHQHEACAMGCTKVPTYGVEGTAKRGYCSGHAEVGMFDLMPKKKYAHRVCTTSRCGNHEAGVLQWVHEGRAAACQLRWPLSPGSARDGSSRRSIRIAGHVQNLSSLPGIVAATGELTALAGSSPSLAPSLDYADASSIATGVNLRAVVAGVGSAWEGDAAASRSGKGRSNRQGRDTTSGITSSGGSSSSSSRSCRRGKRTHQVVVDGVIIMEPDGQAAVAAAVAAGRVDVTPGARVPVKLEH